MHIPATLAALLGQAPIYALSPHIDDVIWSAGGFLHALAKDGREVVLVSIFSHSIYVYDEVRPPAEATAIRKGEDYNAARAAGFKEVIFLDYPDGILRDTPQTKVINPGYETPPYLLAMVTDSLRRIIPRDAVVLAPAAFGGHMDHLTTRRAALPLTQTKILYRDMPYGSRTENTQEALKFLSSGWQNFQITLEPSDVKAHLDLFWHYQSQTSREVADEISTQLTRDGLNFWIASKA